MRKIVLRLSFMLLIVIMGSTFLGGVSAVYGATASSDSSISNFDTNLNEKLYADMHSRYPESFNKRSIQNIKDLTDMNGTVYHLTEFFPAGYSIHNYDYSIILEISCDAKSPYLDKTGSLIYLGAFNYFTYNQETSKSISGSINHCLEDYTIILNQENVQKITDFAYSIKGQVEQTKLERNATLAKAAVYQESTSVSDTSILTGANTVGFNVDNNCGYVAASLIVFYAARSWGWTYLYDDTKINKSLVEEIQNGKAPLSWAPDVEDSLNKFLNKKGATHKAKVYMWHIPAAHTFYDRVKENKPVILFGSLPNGGTDVNNKINHAVVVYSVERTVKSGFLGIKTYSDYIFTVHWGGYSSQNSIQLSHSAIMIGGLVNLHRP